jgi:O-antigen/teichoic acid export membrane protein
LINAAERACAIVAVGVLWQVLPGGDAIVGCATGCVLFVVRLLGTSAQWRAMMVEDRTRSAAGAAQPPQESPRARASRLHTTAAAFFNSCTAYVPVLLLDHFGHKADLALYALVQQSANVVILFQGVASRLFSRRIAEASDETGGVQVIFQAARRVGGTSALLATAGAAFTAAYLLHVGTYGTPAKVLALVAILFSWGAWLGFGQIVTRALVLGGHARAYSHAAAATVFGALVAAWALAPRFGAVGAALAIALPHSVMIAFCAFALRRNAARISSP